MQFSDTLNILFFASVCKEPKMSDPHKPTEKQVQQKPPDKLLCIQCLCPLNISMLSVSVGKDDFAVFYIDNPIV